MIHELLDSGYASGVHLYTLNREVAPTSILKKLGVTSFVNDLFFISKIIYLLTTVEIFSSNLFDYNLYEPSSFL